MEAPAAATAAHLISGPIDAIIEVGLPLALFAVLWWWSARKERKDK